jgi:hypothetical protein
MRGHPIKFLVKPDTGGGRCNILRVGKPTGAFARDVHTAIDMATQSASKEAHDSYGLGSVYLSVGGKTREVWPG